MRRTYTMLALLALFTFFAGCTAERVNSPANGNANAGNAPGATGNSAGSREGVGPNSTGIGGTSEGNRNSAVKGNSNVEPTGVNRNAGGGNPPANVNQ
ncbi:MAG TPA: hypothetical protein VGW12_19405 [Pyrinomonadaceae bacterium]|nr:hypothetical protein [Pyrinomonadaceae bacterium]